eukprot:TRINITY_DN836_c0_g1_i1.p2 TRINITY_DN836_c0_g1~~TRINITY_DN836_c0_g1_i1.p2  ORF type:complete len:367 (+),score=125.04 TRINITY_DN836_c0_g1_i1:166-1266(+)
MFALSCAVDLFGMKHNAKLEFPSCPTMTELINAVESQFDVLVRSARPAGYPDVPFKAQTFQVYDAILLRWVDVYTAAQLSHGCQLFVFQPPSIWHSDSQGIIPEAKDNVTWMTPAGSPRQQRVHMDTGVAPGLAEKLRCVYYDMDCDGKGFATYEDLRAAFARADMETVYATVSELFVLADENRDGELAYDEWIRFAIKYPNVVDGLYYRVREGGGAGAAAPHATPAGAALLRAPPGLLPNTPFDKRGQRPLVDLGNPLPFFPHHTASPAEEYRRQTAAVLNPPSPDPAIAAPLESVPLGVATPAPPTPPFPAHLAHTPRESAELSFERAKRRADEARAAKAAAEAEEREAWDRLHRQHQQGGGYF